MALCATAQDASYSSHMSSEMGMGGNAPITVTEDNQACITHYQHPQCCISQTKHIDIVIRYHYYEIMKSLLQINNKSFHE